MSEPEAPALADGPAGDGTVAWRVLYREATERLADAGFASPAADARWLVEHASGHEGAEFRPGLDRPATVGGVRRFDAALARRLGGEPLQYVIGSWPFRELDLFVDARVLIPRPETEVVAGRALAEIDRLRASGRDEVVVVDLGTGSGAIALSVAAERDRVEVWATDASADALDVARANLAGLGRRGSVVRLAGGSWFEALPGELRGRVDVVVSNPPYIAEAEVLPDEVAGYEPVAALRAGPRGTEALEHLIDEAPGWLAPAGALVLELAPGQAGELAARARASGLVEVELVDDLAGRHRAVVGRRPGS